MSELIAEFDSTPYYTIRSVIAGGRSVAGVNPTLPAWQHVRIDTDIHLWKIKPTGEPGIFRLSLKDSYPYTGVEGTIERSVIATTEVADDREWHIRRLIGVGNIYSIELKGLIRPISAWAVSSEEPGAKIVLKLYEIEPWESQQFRIEPAYD